MGRLEGRLKAYNPTDDLSEENHILYRYNILDDIMVFIYNTVKNKYTT